MNKKIDNIEKNTKRKFYVTTAIPYVNAKPHVGHALEFVQADVISRFHKFLGENSVLLSGSDDNALKNVQAAENAGKPIQEFVNENSMLFQKLAENLNVKFDFFQKGSDKNHYESSQNLWNLCSNSGDIYKKDYTGFYCVGCELFYEREELNENGECFEHPGKPLQQVSESNYFFKLSKYEDRLKNLISIDQLMITPISKKNEMLAFIDKGLEDISISRSNKRAKNWGVGVPNDPSQRMYVWFDALNIYRSGLGDKYNEFWPCDVHVIGKGISRFHAIYWPAFLLSAKLPLPKSIFVHGYFTVDGQKMSKTLGNVIDPINLINKYGTDALRYYFLSQIPSTTDGDFSEEKLKAVYNSDLANGLGNLVSRVSKLCENSGFVFGDFNFEEAERNLAKNFSAHRVLKALDKYDFFEAINIIWHNDIKLIDQEINKNKPWLLEGKQLEADLKLYVDSIRTIAILLTPFLPETSSNIKEIFKGSKIRSSNPLFPRIV